MKNNKNNESQFSKIELKNIEELKSYLHTALSTVVNGSITGLEIKFLDNTKVKLVVEQVV